MEKGIADVRQTVVFRYDHLLLLTTFALLVFGLLLLASASMSISAHDYGNPFHFLLRQFIYILAGIFVGTTLLRTPIAIWEKIGGYLLLFSILLLILVLVPGIGRQINGSIRWIGIGGLTVQVSELAKLGVAVYMAGYLVRRSDEVQNRFSGFLKPLVVVGIVSLLLLMEPDFGAMVVIVCTVLGMIYLAGARLWQFLILLIFAALVLWMLAIASPYRLLRMTSFLNPWAMPFDSGYQLTQSLIAFGRGGFWGAGLGNSVQKLFYLPEAHTDFLFAVLAEELGIFGQLLALSLFGFLVSRAFYIASLARRLQDYFSAYLAYGIGLILALQVIINVGVNTGILPTKGLTLPFMSYGGTSIMFNCAIIALLLRIYHECKVTNLE